LFLSYWHKNLIYIFGLVMDWEFYYSHAGILFIHILLGDRLAGP